MKNKSWELKLKQKRVNEIWLDIKDYEGIYQVSTLGRVKRLKGKGCKEDRILKQIEGGAGYLKVCLYKEGKKSFRWVHRLVAQTFIGDYTKDKLEIDHIDRNKKNNKLDNLRWLSHKENCKRNFEKVLDKRHKYNQGRDNKGDVKMEKIKNILKKLGVEYGVQKIKYDNIYITDDTIIQNEIIYGIEFKVYCLTFGDTTKEYGLFIEEYGMLEDTEIEIIIDELSQYFS